MPAKSVPISFILVLLLSMLNPVNADEIEMPQLMKTPLIAKV